MRRPVVIVGDSESGSGAATAGIDATVGADMTASSAGLPTGPAFPTGIDTRIAAVGAFAARAPGDGTAGATGGFVPDRRRPRLTLLSENPAVEPTGEKPSASRRSSASSPASAYRFALSFARHFAMISCIPSGTSLDTRLGSGGSS